MRSPHWRLKPISIATHNDSGIISEDMHIIMLIGATYSWRGYEKQIHCLKYLRNNQTLSEHNKIPKFDKVCRVAVDDDEAVRMWAGERSRRKFPTFQTSPMHEVACCRCWACKGRSLQCDGRKSRQQWEPFAPFSILLLPLDESGARGEGGYFGSVENLTRDSQYIGGGFKFEVGSLDWSVDTAEEVLKMLALSHHPSILPACPQHEWHFFGTLYI